MNTYIVLLRGINVGGKNKIAMTELKICLEKQGLTSVITYIQSGNLIVRSELDREVIRQKVETCLPKNFQLDSSIIKVLVLSLAQLQAVVTNRPKGFGDQPDKYYSDVIFLIDIKIGEAMAVFDPREGVDKIWPGSRVIYSQRLGSQRAKSRLAKIIGAPVYKSMTIRSWNTATKLLDLAKKTTSGNK